MRVREKILMVFESLVPNVLRPGYISTKFHKTPLYINFKRLPCLAKQVSIGFLWLPATKKSPEQHRAKRILENSLSISD